MGVAVEVVDHAELVFHAIRADGSQAEPADAGFPALVLLQGIFHLAPQGGHDMDMGLEQALHKLVVQGLHLPPVCEAVPAAAVLGGLLVKDAARGCPFMGERIDDHRLVVVLQGCVQGFQILLGEEGSVQFNHVEVPFGGVVAGAAVFGIDHQDLSVRGESLGDADGTPSLPGAGRASDADLEVDVLADGFLDLDYADFFGVGFSARSAWQFTQRPSSRSHSRSSGSPQSSQRSAINHMEASYGGLFRL